jgi:hypothetical protein
MKIKIECYNSYHDFKFTTINLDNYKNINPKSIYLYFNRNYDFEIDNLESLLS